MTHERVGAIGVWPLRSFSYSVNRVRDARLFLRARWPRQVREMLSGVPIFSWTLYAATKADSNTSGLTPLRWL